MAFNAKKALAFLPVTIAAVILVVMGLIASSDTRRLMTRAQDMPPRIEFTWVPAGPVSLKEMRGFLTMKDDYALDFSTYRMTLVEVGKTVDLPIEGMIGKDYEQQVSFSLIADNPRIADKDKLTVEISIADDRGQRSTLTRVITLRR